MGELCYRWHMSQTPRRAPDPELLAAEHEFPGDYVIKAFGPGDGEFEASMRSAVLEVVSLESAQFSSRTSARGNKICVTAELRVRCVEEVVAVYERIHQIESLLLIF